MKLTPDLFENANKAQSRIIGREITSFNKRVNKPIFETVMRASDDVSTGTINPPLYVIPANTGAGKTTFTIALIAELYKNDPSYTAAIILPTIQGAHGVYERLSELIGETDLYIHTSIHRRPNPKQALEDHGIKTNSSYNPTASSNVSGLKSHRIIICTHDHWLNDLRLNTDLGVSLYKGKTLRSNTFIDERPSLIETREIYASDLEFLSEQFDRDDANLSEAVNLVKAIKARMIDIASCHTALLGTADIIDSEEYDKIDCFDVSLFGNHSERVQKIMEFLEYASLGRCIISKGCYSGGYSSELPRGIGFISYSAAPDFKAGTILLDATAEVHQLLADTSAIQIVDIPKVDYSNLKITHLESASKHKNIKRANDEILEDYLNQITSWIYQHTEAKEKLLLVLPKTVREFVGTKLSDTDRDIKMANWGMGIGSNDWRDSTSVFLLDEFHLPKEAYLLNALAKQDCGCSPEVVKQAVGGKLTGFVKDEMEGHRLRWFAQMASRGTMRVIDDVGHCRPMKLFTTMDYSLLAENYSNVFPHALKPVHIPNSFGERNTLPKRLNALLLASEENKLCTTFVANELGVQPKALTRAFKSQTCRPSERDGWKLEKGDGRIRKACFVKVRVVVPPHIVNILRSAA